MPTSCARRCAGWPGRWGQRPPASWSCSRCRPTLRRRRPQYESLGGDPLAATDQIASGQPRTIDLAVYGASCYATVLASGFDSLVNERANRISGVPGRLRYTFATIAELRVFTPRPYTLELDGVRQHTQAMLVAVGNGPSYVGGLRMCEGALVDDSMLDVVIIKPLSRRELVAVYPRQFKGTHVTHPAYEHHRVRQASIATGDMVAYADGERLSPLPATIDIAPVAVTVLTGAR